MKRGIRRSSYTRPGRLVPANARGLRARSIVLDHGEQMAWHTTGMREELLITLAGRMRLEMPSRFHRVRSLLLRPGQCVFLPASTMHRVVNHSRAQAHYLYVTAPIVPTSERHQ